MRFFIITCFLITSFQSYSQGLKLIAPGLSAEIDYGSGSFSSFDAETGQEVSLHHFQSVGTSPQSSLLQIDGYLYGTTHQGGNYGDGTIFKVSTDGEEFLKLHDFEAGEGQWPNGVIQAADGFLYGMTQRGGPKNVYGTYGVIYKIKTDGSQFEVIHEFSGSRFDGREPLGDLIEGTDGKLYGMTQLGGYNTPNYVDAEGIIFRIDTDGGNFELLYDMKPETGTQPMGNLTQLADGSFAGMTRLGGDHETGVLFKYDPLTDEYLVIHQFPPTSYPRGSLVLHENGSLYGMTTGGGPFKSGTIFRIETDGTGYVSLYEFKGDEYPDGALVPHDDGYLYGQANNGGTNDAGYVFRIHEENYTFEKIRDFDKHNKWPVGTPAFDESGKLCLATSSGGLAGYGTVVSMRTDGTELEILHDFSTGLPRSPKGNFLKSGSNYFGTSEVGGDNNLGTIYALSEDSNEVLHSFSGIEGRWPNGFISGPEGRCYGLAGGGSNSLGVLYSFDPEDSTFSVLHHFDNQNCMGQLLISTDQNIYGFTTYKTFRYDLVEGTYEELSNLRTSFNIGPKDIHGAFAEGSDGYLYGMGFDGLGCTDGCIFKTSKDGSEFDIVYDFASHTGNYPYGSLISGSDNKWYGVTSLGGKNGKGVVFSINEDMSNYSVLHHFDETNGSKPRGTLLLRNDHRLYGTTSEGGDYDRGVIFTINADGTGFTKITDLKANYQRYNFSLQAEGNSKPNYLGTSSFEALEDGPGFTIPFNNNFYDDHDNPANLIYGLVSNSNQTLINVSLSDTAFHFDLIPDAFGVAEVILSARDSEDSELQIPVQITINPVADTPVGTEVEVPYGHLTKISDFLQRSGVDGEEVTHLIFWNVKGGTLYLADSVTRVYNGMVMPYNDYQEEGLVFLARAGKDVSFEVRASVSAYHSGKGGDLVNITVRINKAPLTITAKSYSTIYGEILPEFEATYEGFLFSDRILGIENPPTFYIADESNQVGNHEILMSDASDARYEITLVSGTLSITKAQLSVLVDDQVRTYGAENPELTYSYDGFVNGEGATDLESEPEVTTTATEA
ncbi:MAG: MBG domain-containing protein, partial [Marinoscillum sp.]